MPISSDDVLVRRAMRRLGGSLCGRYSLSRLIGIGGMAAVYAGVHRNGHAVAVKILHERLATDPEIERLFRREAHLANAIGHSGVVPVIDDDVTDDGCVFLVMPLLLGETLRARAARLGKTLPVQEVVVLAHAVLETLAAAHAKRIVHRDIKPENVFVTISGEVKVLDFGIGRFFQTNETASATRTGRALGTPAFMAPEQALGRHREVDGRTDLWALGATMFALLTGRFVHEAESPTEVAVLAATRPAPLLGDFAPEVPSELRAVIDQALAFAKEDRWGDAAEMDRALLQAARDGLRVSEPDLPRVAAPSTERDENFDAVPTRVPQAQPIAAQDTSLNSVKTPQEEPQSVATPAERGPVAAPSVSSTGWRNMALGSGAALAVVIVIAIGVAIIRRASSSSVSSQTGNLRGNKAAVIPGVEVDFTALSQAPVSPSAQNDYLAGIQLWRGAASWDSIAKFASATAAEPEFAPAHLWYLLATNYVAPAVREHFAAATLYRERLTASQADLLEALRPSMQDPPALSETGTRLEALLAKHPDNADLRVILARVYYRLGDSERGLRTIGERAVHGEPALTSYVRVGFFSLRGDGPRLATALDDCVAASAIATDCLTDQWAFDAHEGRCSDIAPVCRRLLAIAPTTTAPFDCLVDSLSSTGAPEADIRATFDEQLKRVAPARVARVRAEHEVTLAIADGRLSDAESLAKAWQATTEGYQNPSQVRGAPYFMRVDLDVELGRVEAAARLAAEFSSASQSWLRNDYDDLRADAAYIKSISGSLSPVERTAAREQVLAASASPSYGTPLRRWINAYGLMAWSAAEATLAVANMPTGLNPSPDVGNAQDNYLFGRVLLLAGERERAQPFFLRASKSCEMDGDIERTRAALEAARLTSDVTVACALSARVVKHWSRSPESVTVRGAKKRQEELHCDTIAVR